MVEPLPWSILRWRCDSSLLPFETTAEIDPIAGVIGQPSAVEALRFGLESDAPGQNVFVRGLTGTGRMTLISRMLDELQLQCRVERDLCYVHNFVQPDRPRLITLPSGQARRFRRRLHELGDFIAKGLGDAMNEDTIRARREAIEKRVADQVDEVTAPFRKALADAGMALVIRQVGQVPQTAIFPVIDGKPVAPEEYERLRAEGAVTGAQYEEFQRRHGKFHRQLEDISVRVSEIRRDNDEEVRAVVEEAMRTVLGAFAEPIRRQFVGDDVQSLLNEIIEHTVENIGAAVDGDGLAMFGVNILIEHETGERCPIIIENIPTMGNLLGTVERAWGERGPMPSDYRLIRAGSLLRADGGYLILDARDVLAEPGAWKVLIRTLRSGLLEIVPP